MAARFALVALFVGAVSLPAQANLISNPGFETFTGSYGGDGCRQLVPSSTTLTDWTPVGTEIAICTTPNQYLITASEALHFLDIAGYQNVLHRGVSQALTGLVVGQSYAFTADLGISNNPSCVPGANCGGPISVLVTIGSVSQTLTHNAADTGVQWATYGFTFVADSATPTLTVTGASLPAGGAFIGLDHLALVAAPLPDADSDGVPDEADNCLWSANLDQLDRGGIGASSLPDGIGDACQCGDVTGDGTVSLVDALVIRRSLLLPATATMTRPELCDVGGSTGCSTADAVVITRALLLPPIATIAAQCPPATP